ncbi:MAG: hypothetical protein IE919_16300, partial [Thioclava sp.]|nr:hypothetical protein [Thioclava sp.]
MVFVLGTTVGFGPALADSVLEVTGATGQPGTASSPGSAGADLAPGAFSFDLPASVSDFGYLFIGGIGGNGIAGADGANGANGAPVSSSGTDGRAGSQGAAGVAATDAGPAGAASGITLDLNADLTTGMSGAM